MKLPAFQETQGAMRRLFALPILLSVSCDTGPQWQAWVYPNREELTRSVPLGSFKTFNQCQAAALEALRSLKAEERGDYECGFKCKWRPDMGINVCTETRN
jgi:hypothetical protein